MKITDEAVEAGTKACRDITFNALSMDECRDAVRKSLEAALPLLSQGAVSMKPLEWVDADEGMCTKWRAAALGGHYELVSFDKEPGFAVNFHWGRPLSFWFIQGEPDEWGPTGPKIFPTLEEAKAAAQADYERRTLSPAPVGVTDGGSMTPEEIRLENLKQMAAFDGPIVSFEFQEPYYLASCDQCGWVGSSERCGTDSYGDDSDVHCPRCFASGADCGKVAAALASSPVGVTDEMVQKFITTSRDEDAGYQNWTEAVTAGLNAALASHEPAPDVANDESERVDADANAMAWGAELKSAEARILELEADLEVANDKVERLRDLLDRTIPETMEYDAESGGFYDTELTHDIRAALGGQSNE